MPVVDRIRASLRTWSWEWAWFAFAAANIAWMEILPDWISIPFHFIWVSFTLLFGFRIWTNRLTWTLALLVVFVTGVVLIHAWIRGMRSDELFEIPLMFCMFLAMVWHTNRRKLAFTRMRQVSEQNARMLEREHAFIQNASHELRTPVTVALAHAELAQFNVDDGPVKEDVTIIADELGRLRRLTDRLLLLAAVDAPELAQREPTDLVDLVQAAVRRWTATPRDWQIGRHDEATVLADPERLVVALDTVVENAVGVTADGAQIELSVTTPGDGFAVVEVSDSGPGISPELLDSLFERFRTHKRPAGSPGGFGLGLAIVDAITTAHGGSVTARNRTEGGAVVALRLPLIDAPGRGSRRRTHQSAGEPAPTSASDAERLASFA